jgi:hypothetical protein
MPVGEALKINGIVTITLLVAPFITDTLFEKKLATYILLLFES